MHKNFIRTAFIWNKMYVISNVILIFILAEKSFTLFKKILLNKILFFLLNIFALCQIIFSVS